MKIGIAYDLREDYLAEGYGEEETAEFDRSDTIEAIEKTLRELGFETDRIGNIKSLVKRLASGERFDMVFNIAEGLRGFGREAAVPALLDAYDIPYAFSDPLVLALTLHKGMTKSVLRDNGIPTADFRVVDKIENAGDVNLPFPLFVKPAAEGTGKGISAASIVRSREDLMARCRFLIEEFKQPALVETFLPGREYTVGIVGSGKEAVNLGVMEIILRERAESDVYSFTNKEEYEDLVDYRLLSGPDANAAEDVALRAWRVLGCRDGGRVDLRCDAAGVPNFLEVNPLAGLHPVRSDLPILSRLAGVSYRELIDKIMQSALKRMR